MSHSQTAPIQSKGTSRLHLRQAAVDSCAEQIMHCQKMDNE